MASDDKLNDVEEDFEHPESKDELQDEDLEAVSGGISMTSGGVTKIDPKRAGQLTIQPIGVTIQPKP